MSEPNKKGTRVTRAKFLTAEQFEILVNAARQSENALRDEVLLRLSFNCGLRAGEIAGVQWTRHILDARGRVGKVLRVTSDIAKGANNRVVERTIPMPAELRKALTELRKARPRDTFVVYALSAPRHFTDGMSNRTDGGGCAPNTLVQYFRRLYALHGFVGCTSHSGRRSAITTWGRTHNNHGASIRDVQLLAGHRSLETTALYIEPSEQQIDLIEGAYQ